MSQHTLSVVQLCPDALRPAAEALAEAAGFGPGNLSVPLTDAQGARWWGCHAWWSPAVLAAHTPPTGEEAADQVLSQVVTSVRDGGDPREHWTAALESAGLTEVDR